MVAGVREAGAVCPWCQKETACGDAIAVCGDCGAVHHQLCWQRAGHCGAYACSPARRPELPESPAAIQVSSDELEAAVPLPRRSVQSTAAERWSVPPREQPRTSRLAIASFVCALLGIPLFGIVTGLLAIILAAAALSAMAGTRLRGASWAVAGILVGIFDMAGWVVFLIYMFGFGLGGPGHLQFMNFETDVSALDGLRPEIGRAMRANVLIDSQLGRSGFGGHGIGSGVIMQFDKGDALVLTNRHVVDRNMGQRESDAAVDDLDSTPLTVKLIGQQPVPGHVIWIAPGGIDAAFVRVRCTSSEAEAAPWSKDTSMHIGDPVFAIGNPHNLEWTHTQGTISQFRLQGARPYQVRVIQTQTAINPGNSGGGLYDHLGNLVGINTWTNDKRVSEGISFAIALQSLLAQQPTCVDADADTSVKASPP
jgi:hypothetical protein